MVDSLEGDYSKMDRQGQQLISHTNVPTFGPTGQSVSTALANRLMLEKLQSSRPFIERLSACMRRYIASYVGAGNLSKNAGKEIASITAKEARQMLKSTFIIQEYISGGTFKSLIISQVRCLCNQTSFQEAPLPL